MVGAFALLGSVLAGGPGSAAEPVPAGAKAWAAMFADPDRAAEPARMRAVLRACGEQVGPLKQLIASDAAYRKHPPGWLRRFDEVSDRGKKMKVEFLVRVPNGYTPDRVHPVLLAGHGLSMNGRSIAQMMLRLLGGQADEYLLVAPTMPGPREYNGRAYQEQTYLRALAWVRRNLNVDDDRICLSGYSMGGHTTWHVGTMHPRHFAAVVQMAGVPWFEGFPYTATVYLENLAHLRFWSIWGEKDIPLPRIGQVFFNRQATRRLEELSSPHYVGRELRGVGHVGCTPEPKAFAEFLAKGRRVAVPEQVTHFFHLDHHRRGYYLEATKLYGRPMQMSRHVYPKLDPKLPFPEAWKRTADYYRKFLFKMWGELDRSSNALAIRTWRVNAVRVYVIEGMFDHELPVRLRYNRRSWRGLVPRSARCMLTHYAADRDATALVVNEIDIDYRGRATVRYK